MRLALLTRNAPLELVPVTEKAGEGAVLGGIGLKRWIVIAAIGLMSGLPACVVSAFRALDAEVYLAPNLNYDSPLAVDFVAVYDRRLLDRVSSLSARQWFAGKQEMQGRYSSGKRLGVWSWEWVPGQRIQPLAQAFPRGAAALVIFANYSGSGDHRHVLREAGPIQVRFLQSRFVVTRPGNPAGSQ